MKKFIKKTIAGLIAGVMAISSMPFAVLTAQAADSTEKTYVKSNIESFTGYTGTASAPTTNWYGNPEVANALYVSPEYSDTSNYVSKTYINSDGQKYKFMGYKDVVLLNTTTPAYFPVTFEEQGLTNYSGTAKREYDYIATTTNGFQTKDNWVECSDWHTYTAKDSGITASGDINYNNTTTGSSMGYPVMSKNTSRDFRNKVYLNQGEGNVSQYYDKYDSISFDIRLDYYYSYWSFGSGTKTDTLQNQLLQGVTYEENKTVYVVNYKPIAEKISAMKDVYADIKANGEENYAEADLNAFYQAAYKVMTLNPNSYAYSTNVEKAVQDAGNAIKDVVDHYLTTATTKLTKVIKLNTEAYDSALTEAEEKAKNTDGKYTTESINALQTEIASVKTERENVKTQAQLEALTTRLLTAISNLVQTKFTVKFVKIGKDTNPVEEPEKTVNYGDTFQANAGANVKGWIVKTNGDKTKTRLNTLNQEVSVVITEDTTIEAYLSGEEATANSSKATFYGRHNQVVAIKYVADGQPLDTSDVEVPKVPFYDFVKWDVSQTDDGKEYIVKAVYKCVQAEDDKCIVHFNGKDKAYTYNSYVYLFGADKNKKYALYDENDKLLVVLDGVDFYTPQRKHIYVKEYKGTEEANVAVMGSFATKKDGQNTAVYNCKFNLPEGATAIEWGVAIKFDNGSVKKFSIKEKSKRNEYSANVKAPATIKKVTAAAYVTYKQGETEETKMSDFVTVDLSTL